MPSIFFQDPYAAGRAVQGASDTLKSAAELKNEREKYALLRMKAEAEAAETARLEKQRAALRELAEMRISGLEGRRAQLGPQANPAEERFQRIRSVAQDLLGGPGGQQALEKFITEEEALIDEERNKKAIGLDAKRIQAAVRDGLIDPQGALDMGARLRSPKYKPGEISEEIGTMRQEALVQQKQERAWEATSQRMQQMIQMAPDPQTAEQLQTIHDLWWHNRDETPFSAIQRQFTEILFPGSGGEKTTRDKAIEIAVKEGDLRPERVAEIEEFIAASEALPAAQAPAPPVPTVGPPRRPFSAAEFRGAQDRKRQEREARGFVGSTRGEAAPKPWASRPQEEQNRVLDRLVNGILNPRSDAEALFASAGFDAGKPLPPEVKAELERRLKAAGNGKSGR